MALLYCKRCGRTVLESIIKREKQVCDCCKGELYVVPSKYLDENCDFLITDDKMEEALYEELVKPSPEFDQYLFDHREEILAKDAAEFEAMLARGRAYRREQERKATCPSCGSTNVSKIGTLSRMVSVGLFGLASSKIGKTHKCNHCGTTW